MIYRAYIHPGSFITLVVRASSEDAARRIATVAARVYDPASYVDEMELFDPEGPEGVLVEDAS